MSKKILKEYELNSNLIPLFRGTYETMWGVNEYEDNGDEIEVEYNSSDFMKSIIDAYINNQESILRDLKEAVNFITNIEFTGNFNSPREYNFSTDVIDFNLTVDVNKLNKTLNQLKDDVKFQTFLKDNYSSRDGFISFTPDNYKDIKEAIDTNNSESDQAIAAVITYLTQEQNILNEIEELVCEDWACNGYNGLDYKIVEY